jgi:hypothetical protein
MKKIFTSLSPCRQRIPENVPHPRHAARKAIVACWHELVGSEAGSAGQNNTVDDFVATAAVHEKRDFEIFTSEPVSDRNVQLVRKF